MFITNMRCQDSVTSMQIKPPQTAASGVAARRRHAVRENNRLTASDSIRSAWAEALPSASCRIVVATRQHRIGIAIQTSRRDWRRSRAGGMALAGTESVYAAGKGGYKTLSAYSCPAGRAHCAWGGRFVTRIRVPRRATGGRRRNLAPARGRTMRSLERACERPRGAGLIYNRGLSLVSMAGTRERFCT